MKACGKAFREKKQDTIPSFVKYEYMQNLNMGLALTL